MTITTQNPIASSSIFRLSLRSGHPYLSAPPDHPLFLLLSDIAADHGVPIDLHMEAIPQEMMLPRKLSSPPNPPVLQPNIAGFQRLLAHNRGAKIIWAHAGWDNTGFRTAALMGDLLKKHSNLFMSIKINSRSRPRNSPLNRQGGLKQEWLDLIREFPGRFLVGSDLKYGLSRVGRTEVRIFLSNLPSDLARKVGHGNSSVLFKN